MPARPEIVVRRYGCAEACGHVPAIESTMPALRSECPHCGAAWVENPPRPEKSDRAKPAPPKRGRRN